MPKLGPSFSESSFAFAFTENLLHGGLLTGSAAPRFLSTYAEGMGEHWDAHIPTHPVAFFFQFKIPDVLQRGRMLKNFVPLRSPFYRMNLRSENGYAQHHGLRRLEHDGENVYYVCPRFHEGDDFNALYGLKIVPQRSAWFRPSQATPPDYLGPHGIVYDIAGHDWEIRSPKRIPRQDPIDYPSFVFAWNRAVDSATPRRSESFIASLSESVETAIRASEEGRAAVEALGQETLAGDVAAIFDYQVERELPPPPRFRMPEMGMLAKTVTRARGILGLEILIGGKD